MTDNERKIAIFRAAAGLVAGDPELRAASSAADLPKKEISDVTPAPDPYAKDLAALKAAEQTTASTFEDTWKAARYESLAAERERMRAHIEANPGRPRLTAAETRSYAPPDPYAAALKALREKEAK